MAIKVKSVEIGRLKTDLALMANNGLKDSFKYSELERKIKIEEEILKEKRNKCVFEPAKRTALDGKTWWVVWDRINKCFSPITYFGKYKRKWECQLRIDMVCENYDEYHIDNCYID